jgi:hypothetical protein
MIVRVELGENNCEVSNRGEIKDETVCDGIDEGEK